MTDSREAVRQSTLNAADALAAVRDGAGLPPERVIFDIAEGTVEVAVWENGQVTGPTWKLTPAVVQWAAGHRWRCRGFFSPGDLIATLDDGTQVVLVLITAFLPSNYKRFCLRREG